VALKIKGLRIKRDKLIEIEKGDKNIEYRAYKDYYTKRFKDAPSHLLLTDQHLPYKILVEVTKVKVINTPKNLDRVKYNFGAKVYAIHLGERCRVYA
jgi:hypothetical protein